MFIRKLTGLIPESGMRFFKSLNAVFPGYKIYTVVPFSNRLRLSSFDPSHDLSCCMFPIDLPIQYNVVYLYDWKILPNKPLSFTKHCWFKYFERALFYYLALGLPLKRFAEAIKYSRWRYNKHHIHMFAFKTVIIIKLDR